ncbi:hypothetical protein ASD03_21475 [Ensifer sp. Root127]|nr:hypothetical protein ASD03_21475 [Ensifer sp. Root127]
MLEILDKNFPKFDVTMKIMFAVQNSYLRQMLDIPLGHDLPPGFPDFEQTEVDALVRRNGKIFHVEFQSWNDSRMVFRMLDYRNSIYRHYRKQGRRTVTPDIVQMVVYIGSPPMRMESELQGTKLDFSYSLHDIREFWFSWRNRLVRSRLPLNWILALICSDAEDETMWKRSTQAIRDHLDTNGGQSDLPLPAVLLVAATLRNMSDDFRREIISMFTMNIENDPLFREIYEQGNARAAKVRLLRMIGIGLDTRAIELDDTQNEELAGWRVEDLDALADAMMAMISNERLLAWLPRRAPTEDNSHDGL